LVSKLAGNEAEVLIMNEDKSPHILVASTSLVGFTFIVLTSLQTFNIGKNWFIEEIVAISVVGFMLSTIFSFLSIRTNTKQRMIRYENVADFIFFSSLFLVFVVCVLLAIFD
jgi:hypothetical protein